MTRVIPGDDGGRFRRSLFWSVVALALAAVSASARAEEPVRIGIGFGLAFLPIYLCDDLKLVEKYGREARLDLKAHYERFLGAAPLQDAIRAGTIDMGPFGIAPLLAAWEKAKGTPRQILAVSGITSLPLVLLSDRANVHTIADFKPADQIAMPAASSPQKYLLQMQSEKILGRYDRLAGQIVILPHPDAVAALMAATGPVAGYFSSAPYTQIALVEGRIHKVLSSTDVIDGGASFIVMGATRAYIAAHPKIPEVIAKAIEEAARLIRDDPRRAAQIFLAHEPSKTLDAAHVEAVVRDIRGEFGSALRGVGAFADFMGRHGELPSPPQSWKDIVAPALLNSPST